MTAAAIPAESPEQAPHLLAQRVAQLRVDARELLARADQCSEIIAGSAVVMQRFEDQASILKAAAEQIQELAGLSDREVRDAHPLLRS